MSLRIEDLGFDYGATCALDGVAAEAAPGSITALIGPNAAGKTTLIRCMAGRRPTRGRVLLDGEPVHRIGARRLARRLAYVAQRPSVAAAFTARQVVELGRYALEPSPGRVEDALRRLDLADVADRPFPALSAGQQQRVALARALAQLEPDGTLVLDEPTSALDLRHVRDALRLLRQLAGGGATVVLAIHDLAMAAAVSDACWLLAAGRLAAAGPTAEVMRIERLRDVFGVEFEWIKRDGAGGGILHPRCVEEEGLQ